MSARKTDDAEVQRVVRSVNYITQEPLLIEMAKTWSEADALYAIDRLETDQPMERRNALRELYWRLRAERIAAEVRILADAGHERRHREVTERLAELKKPHWSVVPNFWLTVAILILTALTAFLAFRR